MRALQRFGENVSQGDGPANGNPQMHRVGLKGEVRPGTRTKGFDHAGIGGGVRGADKAALVLVDAKARDG